jgi:hypothetical protein
MKRRNFFKAIGAGAGALALPAVAEETDWFKKDFDGTVKWVATRSLPVDKVTKENLEMAAMRVVTRPTTMEVELVNDASVALNTKLLLVPVSPLRKQKGVSFVVPPRSRQTHSFKGRWIVARMDSYYFVDADVEEVVDRALTRERNAKCSARLKQNFVPRS